MSHYTFYLRNDKSKKHPILIRFYENRTTRVQINTGIRVSPRYWSKTRNNIKNSSEVAEEYDQFQQKIELANSIIKHYKSNNKTLTRIQFKYHFLQNNISEFKEKEIEFYNELENYIEEKKSRVVADVIKDYNSLKKHLNGFDNFRGYTTNFSHIDYSYYKEWTNYLANNVLLKNGQKGLKNNTIGKQVKNLKAFLNDRMSLKRIPQIDLSSFKGIQEEVDHIYLNNSEIESIANIDCKEDIELEKVKDFFIIACYTGLRFSDCIRIKPSYIDKNHFMNIKQKKTSGNIVIPLRKLVKQTLIKYGNYSPDISSTIFNKRIKQLGQKAKIDDEVELEHKKGNIKEIKTHKKYELITSHTCRRSFCTNAYLDGIDTQLIMQISGHKTEKAFKRYLKLNSYEAALKMKEAWGI